MEKETFTVTKDHLMLLRRMHVGWDGDEFGAPAVDCKRPYGNSDVYRDMAEILGEDCDWDDWDGPTEEQRKAFDDLHAQMRTVLQIVVRNAGIEPGAFVADRWFGNWERSDG